MSFNRPSAPTKASGDTRDAPRIWSEGRQKPPFDLRAFVRVGVRLSRQLARPALLATTRILANAAEGVAENTLGPRLARASPLGRALPPRDGVARGLTATGALMTAAADLAVPPVPTPPADPEPVPPPLLIVRRPRQAELRQAPLRQAEPAPAPMAPHPAAPRPAETADFDAPTLAAIRALIDEMRQPDPVVPTPLAPVSAPPPAPAALPAPSGRLLLTHAVPLTPPEPSPLTLTATLRSLCYRMTAGLLAGAVTLGLLPVGLVKAGRIHLDGDDLRNWS